MKWDGGNRHCGAVVSFHIELLAEGPARRKYPMNVAILIVNHKHSLRASHVPGTVPGTGRITGRESKKWKTQPQPPRNIQVSCGNKTRSCK